MKQLQTETNSANAKQTNLLTLIDLLKEELTLSDTKNKELELGHINQGEYEFNKAK